MEIKEKGEKVNPFLSFGSLMRRGGRSENYDVCAI